jgi:hypothetical protein
MKPLFAAIIASLLFSLTAICEPASSSNQVASQWSTRFYKITPEFLFGATKYRIMPKEGESTEQAIFRLFGQQHIDLQKDGAVVFVRDKGSEIFMRIYATVEDQDKIGSLLDDIQSCLDKIVRPLPEIAGKY